MMNIERLLEILHHIKDEQISHGKFGDSEYVRLCSEGIEIARKAFYMRDSLESSQRLIRKQANELISLKKTVDNS